MERSVELWKRMIDTLVERATLQAGVQASWIRNPWDKPFEPDVKAFLEKLTTSQRELLAKLIEGTHHAGVHTALAAFTDLDVRFIIDGIPVAHQPTGCPSFYDYVCRKEGDDWPADMRSSE